MMTNESSSGLLAEGKVHGGLRGRLVRPPKAASLPACILVIDRDRRVMDATPSFLSLFGLRPENLLWRALEDVFPANPLRPPLERLSDAVFLTGEQFSWNKVCVQRLGDTMAGSFHESGERLLNLRGSLLVSGHCCITIADITFQEEAKRQAPKFSGQLEAGLFVAEVVHEVGNPLGVIKAAAQHCLDSRIGATESEEFFRVILENADFATEFLRQAMEFAAPPPPEFTPCPITRPIATACRLVQPKLRRPHVTILHQIQPHLPDLLADEKQLTQLFVNLLLNSLNAMKAPGRISINCEVHPESNEVVCIFSDSGPGFRMHDLEGLFEPCITHRPSRKGMGLCICRSIVESHGGTIRADNNPSGGARITLEFPTVHRDKIKH